MVHVEPGLYDPRGDDGVSVGRLRPDARAGDRRGRAVHGALRRADDVHRRARPPGVRPLRPVDVAHRRDGRVTVSRRGDEGVRRPHAHDRRDDLLRHDRDVAGVDADAARRLAPPPHGDGRAGPPSRRDPHRRSGDRRDPATWRARRVLHAWLLRDAGLLERRGAHGRSDRRRGMDAHRATSP